MKNSKLKRTSFALLLAVVLMLSLFPVAAYALDEAGEAANGENGLLLDAAPLLTTTAAGENNDLQEKGTVASADKADTTADTTPETDEGTTPETDTDTTPETTPETEKTEETEKKGLSLADIISLAILGVVIILVVVYCLTHKEKVSKLWRGLTSEFKKIVWTPWNQVRKNTIVVLVVIIAAAIVISVADFLFSKGIFALASIF